MTEILPVKRPMKGAQVEDYSKLIFPLWASPKIDGFRCLLGQQPYTSTYSRFPNDFFHREMSRILPLGNFLDSEVVVGKRRGPGVLQRTSSGLTSKEGEPDFTLWVFDRPRFETRPWLDRYAHAMELIQKLGHPSIRLLRHTLIQDLDELLEFIDDKLIAGYEGVMTRQAAAPYKSGKCTLRDQGVLKIKPFVDAEGEVIEFFEEEENTNEAKRTATGKLKRSSSKSGKRGKGTLGGFVLRDLKTGVIVRVGGGFSKAQRESYWEHRHELMGKVVKYKKQATGEKDRPRHPNFVSFLDFRPYWDLG